jgi:hypothetical protein
MRFNEEQNQDGMEIIQTTAWICLIPLKDDDTMVDESIEWIEKRDFQNQVGSKIHFSG